MRNAVLDHHFNEEKYQICIEVTPDFHVRQSLGPYNKPLEGEALDAYFEWCDENNIQRSKAFRIHAAP